MFVAFAFSVIGNEKGFLRLGLTLDGAAVLNFTGADFLILGIIIYFF
jgi:hypothetical protein